MRQQWILHLLVIAQPLFQQQAHSKQLKEKG